MNRDDVMRLAAHAGGRMMHDQDQHEVVAFRPDDLVAFAARIVADERTATPAFAGVALRKLDELRGNGFEVVGYALRKDTERAWIDSGGVVLWPKTQDQRSIIDKRLIESGQREGFRAARDAIAVSLEMDGTQYARDWAARIRSLQMPVGVDAPKLTAEQMTPSPSDCPGVHAWCEDLQCWGCSIHGTDATPHCNHAGIPF